MKSNCLCCLSEKKYSDSSGFKFKRLIKIELYINISISQISSFSVRISIARRVTRSFAFPAYPRLTYLQFRCIQMTRTRQGTTLSEYHLNVRRYQPASDFWGAIHHHHRAAELYEKSKSDFASSCLSRGLGGRGLFAALDAKLKFPLCSSRTRTRYVAMCVCVCVRGCEYTAT